MGSDKLVPFTHPDTHLRDWRPALHELPPLSWLERLVERIRTRTHGHTDEIEVEEA